MTIESSTSTISSALPVPSFGLRMRQLMAIFRVELRQRFVGLRMLPAALLALAPFVLLLLAAIGYMVFANDDAPPIAESVSVFAEIFHSLMLRFSIFFGCAAIFLSLFRGDIQTKSLHYSFLLPVRREVLVAGKFLAGLVAACLVFSVGTALAWFTIYLPSEAGSFQSHFLAGPGLSLLISYLGLSFVACLGYGAVFMAIGQIFKNPILPTVFFMGWEGINLFLPPLLKKISVIHYLQSLGPVPVEVPIISQVTEPTSAPVAIFGLIVFTILVLLYSAWRIRHMEIDYGGD